MIIFYFHFIQPNKYQNINSDNSTKKNLNSKNLNDDSNNLIENLKYEVTINENYKYTLLAEKGTIINKNSFEYINMQNVKATIVDQNNIPLIIKSNKAS